MPVLSPMRIAQIVIGVILVAMLVFGMRACSNNRSLKDQVKIDAGQTGAFRESAGDASNVQAGVATNDAASQDLGRTNEKEIRDAEGSDVLVADPAHAAGMRALCRRAANRDRPECVVFQPR